MSRNKGFDFTGVFKKYLCRIQYRFPQIFPLCNMLHECNKPLKKGKAADPKLRIRGKRGESARTGNKISIAVLLKQRFPGERFSGQS